MSAIDPCSINVKECVIAVCQERFEGRGTLDKDVETSLRNLPIPSGDLSYLNGLEHVLTRGTSAIGMYRQYDMFRTRFKAPWFSYGKLQEAEALAKRGTLEQQIAFRRTTANALLDDKPDLCKPPSGTTAVLSPQTGQAHAHQRSMVELPVDLNPTVATAGAEGVYGTSTLSPLEQTIGRSVEKVAMPVLVLGLLAFGAFKAIETGDTSTVQRAWAMAVR